MPLTRDESNYLNHHPSDRPARATKQSIFSNTINFFLLLGKMDFKLLRRFALNDKNPNFAPATSYTQLNGITVGEIFGRKLPALLSVVESTQVAALKSELYYFD